MLFKHFRQSSHFNKLLYTLGSETFYNDRFAKVYARKNYNFYFLHHKMDFVRVSICSDIIGTKLIDNLFIPVDLTCSVTIFQNQLQIYPQKKTVR